MVGARLGNLAELPLELRSQLKVTDNEETEISSIIDEVYGGAASIDEVLIGMFRRTGVVGDRLVLSRKIYRMTKKGLLFPFKTKRGAYTTKRELAGEQNDDLDENLFRET